MSDNIDYKLRKVTKVRRMCPSCNGTGKREINLGNKQYKTINCSTCDGRGVYDFEHHTDATLIEALTELGIRFVLPANLKPENQPKN